MKNWIPTSKKLPPAGKYVLVHLTKDNWIDSTDPKGVYFKTAKLERGISLKQREKMKSGKLPNPKTKYYIAPNDVLQEKESTRAATWKGADEGHGNNARPYCWSGFGSDYFGQEVDFWMPIPKLKIRVNPFPSVVKKPG